MASVLSPNGRVKKHNLYSRQPIAYTCTRANSLLPYQNHWLTTQTWPVTHPNVRLCANKFVTVQIDHFRSSIRHRCVPLYFLFEQCNVVFTWVCDSRRCAAVVAQHITTAVRLQDILHLHATNINTVQFVHYLIN